MARHAVAPRRGRGLTLRGHQLFAHKHIGVWPADTDHEARILWTWPIDSIETHLDWFLNQLVTILGPETRMGYLQEWRTQDWDTQAPLCVHGWLCGIQVRIPRVGTRALLLLTLSTDSPIADL
jgi:hypothetical protein